MIKNVLFDIGNVIIRWDSLSVARKIFRDEETAKAICALTYDGDYWQDLDAGKYTVDEVIAMLEAEAPEKLRGDIRRAYDYPQYVDIDRDTEELIKRLKGEGYSLYFASNFSERVYDVVERFRLNDYFSGHVFSFEEKTLKPSPEFFKILCKRYRLQPEECVFIDDLPQNVAGAESIGIHGFVFKDNQEEAYRFIKSLK